MDKMCLIQLSQLQIMDGFNKSRIQKIQGQLYYTNHMPPKQKEVKKGPAYKPATPSKDMIPASVKQPPRDQKPLKIPQIQPENADKNIPGGNQIPILFEQWPAEEVVKAYDFGLASEVKFQDKSHDAIHEYLKEDISGKDKMFSWKYLHELEGIKQKDNNRQESQEEVEQGAKSSVNLEEKNNSQGTIEEKSKPMAVIETYLRQQTEQQMQKRKKEEAQKAAQAAKDKKKGKKEQVKQQGPLQVSDVKMSNIVVKKTMCSSGIWIGSQLQIIKIRDLRDVYTEEPVWKKIYPQENGVPQITKSGKYWVKLYYMGKPVKIEIDDRIPINHKFKQLFAKSQKENEKWTLILTKALIKLMAISNPKAPVTGSGMIINALTGMITENVKISHFSDWQKLENMMNDDHYVKKDILVNCFSFNAGKKTPSNFIKNKQEMRDIITLENSTFKKRGNRRSSAMEFPAIKSLDEDEVEEEKIEQQYIESNLIPGYAYCIGDYFQNDHFNMIFSKEKSPRQQKLRLQYNQMSKVVLGNKTRQQKLQHRKKKKQLKQKLLVEEKKRLDLIKRPITKYHFVKLLSELLINCDYSHKEILLAKKCMLNGLENPPNYDMPSLEKKQQMEQSKMGSTTAIKFKDQGDINSPLDDFSSIENSKQPLPRGQQGIWIKNDDLLTIFDEFQFFFNPNIFEFKSIQTVNNKIPKEFTTDQNKEILVVEKKGNPHLQQQNQQNQKDNKIALLFGFAFQQSKWDTLCDPYCMLQKFDFESYRTASNVTTLSKPLSSTYLSLNNNNSVFRIYTISRGKYAYWVSSDSKYKLTSVADYLTEFQAYAPKNFTIQYPAIEKKTFFTLSRAKIRHEGEQNNTLYIKLKNCPKDIEKYLVIKIVQLPENGIYTSQEQEGVILKKQESTHMVYEYSRAELKPGKTYYLILEAYPAQTIVQGAIEMLVLSKLSTNFSIDQAEQIEPYRVIEKYNPNKYAIILKERLFCNANVNASLLLKIFEGEEGQPVASTDKKGSKKGGKEEPTFEVVEKELGVKRLVHVKLFKNGNLIYYAKDYNEVIISNIQFEKTKQGVVYYLEASFDLRDWSGAATPSEETNKLYWSVQVAGEDAIAFVKDTLQEEKQKETRKSWEDKQPGRAEKAKKARQKFLLELKQERGEALTEEQLQIVNAPRLTRKKLLQEEKKNEDKKGAKGAKKDDKKAGKDKKQEVVQEKKEERPVPKSQDNFMKEIKEFLLNLQQCKVTKVEAPSDAEPRIRSDEQQNAIKQGALMAKQNRAAQIVRNIQVRQVMKLKEKEKKDKLTILLEDTKTNFNAEWKKYLQWRIQDQQKDKTKQQKEKALIDIVNQEKPTISQADLTKLINQYKAIEGANMKLADVVDMVRKNIRIGTVSEKINNALQGWQVEALKGITEEIKNDKIQGINQQILGKVQAMLDQAAKNPAIVAQKQAQIKKTKKPGKK